MAPFEEQLVTHGDLADLGAQPLDLLIALVRGPALQRALASGEEVFPPLGERGRRHAQLARQGVERLAAQYAQDHLGLAPRREAARLAPAVSAGRRRGAAARLPRSLASAHVHLPGGASCPPVR